MLPRFSDAKGQEQSVGCRGRKHHMLQVELDVNALNIDSMA
jgi:hypothetical protein